MSKHSSHQRSSMSETPRRQVASGAYADVHDLGSHVAKVAADHRLVRRACPVQRELEEFRRLAVECLEYQRCLHALGVPVPSLEQTIVGPLLDPASNQPISVFTVTAHSGEPLEFITALSPPRATIRADARDVLRAVLPVFGQPRDTAGRVPVGIDMQPDRKSVV